MRAADIIFRIVTTGVFLALVIAFFWPSEKKIEKARRKKTEKARAYQKLSRDMPDVVWTQEIYDQTYKF